MFTESCCCCCCCCWVASVVSDSVWPHYIRAPLAAQRYRIRLQCRNCRRPGFYPWVRKIPWRRAWQPTPVFLPGESHGQRSLAGYSPWGCKVLDTTEATEHAWTKYIVTLLDSSDTAVIKTVMIFACPCGTWHNFQNLAGAWLMWLKCVCSWSRNPVGNFLL